MLTPQQRQRILEFCQEHQIMRIWTMDEPLLNAAVGAGRPSVIVTFRPHWAAVPQQFARMERDLAAITGPETVLYSTDGFSPRLTDQIIRPGDAGLSRPGNGAGQSESRCQVLPPASHHQNVGIGRPGA